MTIRDQDLLTLAQQIHAAEVARITDEDNRAYDEYDTPDHIADQPDNQPEIDPIYDEVLDSVDVGKLLARANQRDMLAVFRKELFRQIRSNEPPAPEPKKEYSVPTQKWRYTFAEIQHRARKRIASLEPTEWEVVYSGTGSSQLGASKRNWILANQADYLMPGVWQIISKNIHDDITGAFIASETHVKYMKDADEDEPENIIVLAQNRGRPRKTAANS